MSRLAVVFAICVALLCGSASAFRVAGSVSRTTSLGRRSLALFVKEKEKSADDIVEESGLEVGLFKTMTSGKEGSGQTAKELLTKYGAAYLVTSISLAVVSFATCYYLIDNGVDVSSLLAKVGINVSGTSETAGTAAIAYAVHKAASPIRFPPTVALTPVVARAFGKDPDAEEEA